MMMNNLSDDFTLLSLNLSGCNLGDFGCEIIFNHIQKPLKIQNIIMEDNKITDEGFAYFLESIRTYKTKPVKVNFSKNQLNDRSIHAFTHLVKHELETCSILEMRVCSNFLQTDSANLVLEFLKKFHKFVRFDIYDQRTDIHNIEIRDYRVIITSELEDKIHK